ncbi:MAG: MMPL family transporter [Myxococcota bacterium]|nr:MMPL family transporter [Myxococcota bacterium]
MTSPLPQHDGASTFFGRIAALVLRNRRATAWSILGLVGCCVALATTLKVNPSIWFLLPEDEPTVVALQELEANDGRFALITLTVRGEKEDAQAFFGDLQGAFENDERIRSSFFDIDESLAWRLGLLQFELSDLAAIRDRIRGALVLGPAVANPFVSASLLDLGPMTQRLKEGALDLPLNTKDGLFRMVIRPSDSPQNLPFTRGLMRDLEAEIDALQSEERGVEVLWIGGPYRHTYEDFVGVVRDMKWTGALAFCLIFGMLSLAFRDFKVLLLVFLPLVVGTVLTFGYAAIVVGELNTFTSFFGTVLIGLGIDFSIHLYTRYREERAQAESLEVAVVRAWDRVGPPCFAAALTTAFGFMAMVVARFRGFMELGLLLSSGVLICLLSVLTILPLLIYWREKQPVPYPRKLVFGTGSAPPTYRFAPLVLLMLLLSSSFAVIGVGNLEVEYDISELRRSGQAYKDLDELHRELARDSFAPVVLSYSTSQELAEAEAHYGELARSGEFPGISDVLSIYSLLPREQQGHIDILREIADFSEHENFGYLPETVRRNLQPLLEVPIEPLGVSDLPESLADLLGAGNEDQHHLMLMATGNLWDLRVASDLLTSVEKNVEDAPAAGQYLVLGSLYQVVRRDTPLICAVSLLLVCIGTLLHLRRPVQALGAVGVLLIGMLWAGAAAATLRIKLSLVNVVGISILLGVGVDVVIHLLHRIREEGPGRVMKALSTTGWAAGLSATTTVLSFAALSLAGQQGIKSLGLLVLVGLTAVTICTFALLPTGWMAAWKISGDMPKTDSKGSAEQLSD